VKPEDVAAEPDVLASCVSRVSPPWQPGTLHEDQIAQAAPNSSKLTVAAERSEGSKLRVTCPTWDDAVAIHPGECLALVNIERQVHVLRAKALCANPRPPAPPAS
jgi:hypothetical protein